MIIGIEIAVIYHTNWVKILYLNKIEVVTRKSTIFSISLAIQFLILCHPLIYQQKMLKVYKWQQLKNDYIKT